MLRSLCAFCGVYSSAEGKDFEIKLTANAPAMLHAEESSGGYTSYGCRQYHKFLLKVLRLYPRCRETVFGTRGTRQKISSKAHPQGPNLTTCIVKIGSGSTSTKLCHLAPLVLLELFRHAKRIHLWVIGAVVNINSTKRYWRPRLLFFLRLRSTDVV